jgi:hypothetical protein
MAILVYSRVVFKYIFYRLSVLPPTYLAFTLTMTSLISCRLGFEEIPWLLLGIGFLSVGISHGVLDYLTDKTIQSRTQFLRFILVYLLKGALLGLVWIALPDIALFVFIAFSAWHFGEADFKEWNLKQGFSSFVWGLIVLIMILFFHYDETLSVLRHIKGLHINNVCEGLSASYLLIGIQLIFILSILFAAYHRSRFMLVTLFYLILSAMLPLIVSFGIYFVVQHSLHGWRHLKTDLRTNSYNLWLKSLPFSAGGIFIFLIFMLVDSKDYMGIFFIILSCFSMPHVISMYNFYAGSNKKYGLN